MKKKLYKNIIIALLILFSIGQLSNQIMASPMELPLSLSQDEKEYIRKRDPIKTAVLDGVAPLHYMDSKGDKQGIAIHILEYIGQMTNLDFQFNFYKTVDATLSSGNDIILGATPKYSPAGMILTSPYLETETALFMRPKLDPNKLKDKVYAHVKGGDLPQGVNKEKTIEYPTRLDTLEAVEKGQADYGYGNEYSISFYSIQNSYKNILTVPMGKEIRKYSIGFLKEDPILLSILDKSIESIDEKQKERFILEMATSIERKVTVQAVFSTYGHIIIGIALIIVALLVWGILVNISYRRKVTKQNKKLIEKNMLDDLVGVYNTSTTKKLIINRLKTRDEISLDALIILDCDKFKMINDNYGHLVGDRALQYVGDILKSSLRHTDIIGRVGGDEFCVYMKDVPSLDFVYKKCQKILDMVGKIDEDFHLTLSVGIKMVERNWEFNDLFYQADQAMYKAKKQGGNTIWLAE